MRRTIAITLTVTLVGLAQLTFQFTQPAFQPSSPGSSQRRISHVGGSAPATAAFEPVTSNGIASDWLAPPMPFDEGVAGPDELGRKDIFGNDVSNAVATYKFDASGSVYEEHAPDTEVPMLPPPTT